MLSNSETLWSHLLYQKYQINTHGMSTVGSGIQSSTWKGIAYGMSLLEKGIQWETSTTNRTFARWTPSSRGTFIVKSAYELLLQANDEDSQFN